MDYNPLHKIENQVPTVIETESKLKIWLLMEHLVSKYLYTKYLLITKGREVTKMEKSEGTTVVKWPTWTLSVMGHTEITCLL